MKTNEFGEEVIPCRYAPTCKNETAMLGTKLCDRCWELETRIKRNLELAQLMIDKWR